MASTEHRLGSEHLAGCLALSEAAGWNQNQADWRLMLDMGHGWGISLGDGMLAASTLVLPYGGSFAWISMVLVHPGHRRKGFASHLLRVATADLARRGLTPVLDATPAGREVYRQEGFHDTWTFKRFSLEKSIDTKAHAAVRALRAQDWDAVLAMDCAAFGASREKLLRALSARLPAAALVYEQANRIRGFVLGRDGRESRQLGPLVAQDAGVARALLDAALARTGAPLYIDLADHAGAPPEGFAFQRPFTRMVHGPGAPPGKEKATFLVAGPELG
jgi:ribosomal protein S18 acetylase RimI-like enzyme